MSVALDGPVDRVDPELPGEHSPGSRRAVIAAVLATLAVILGPLAAAGLWTMGGPFEREASMTPVAQEVLDVAPGAYASGGMVIVPADGSAWTNAVTLDRVDGGVIALDVRGLAQPGYLPYGRSAPAWLPQVEDDDRVFIDVGDLSFACTRWPGATECTGSLMMSHAGEHFNFRSGLGLDSADDVRRFPVLERGFSATLALGVLPPGATSVEVTFKGGAHDAYGARTSEPGLVGGATLWWVSTREEVTEVTFLDADGNKVGTAR